jgi:hypothetical protein
MVGFLPPLVQEAPLRGLLANLAYGAASIASGTALGAALGSLGHLAPAVVTSRAALLSLAGLALWCAAIDVGLARVPLAQRRGQVPVTWLYNLGPLRGAVMYGVSLGTGLVTYISFASFYPVLAWAFSSGARRGAEVMGVYGAAQALPVMVGAFMTLRRSRPPIHAGVLPARWVRVAAAGMAALVGCAALSGFTQAVRLGW